MALLASDLQSLLAVMVKSLESVRARLAPDGSFDKDIAELEGAIDGAYYVCRRLISPGQSRPAEPNVVDLNDLVTQASGVLERFLGPGINVSLNLSPIAPVVAADHVPLECLLLNLAANSRDAMPDGGTFTIETATHEITPSSQQADAPSSHPYVRLTVTDTGRGMTPDIQNRAFEAFFTTRNDRSGLGLTSVMMTVRRLDGFVELSSKVRSGTQVHVYLPALTPTRHH